ncbi:MULTISPECIES: GNAT family N-acetyltransferase [unclassified Acinetobacter]|uniref:GNAT family N-acetyltransferase n=1 Tax=unclassified Acinetobacter TaxID=196816 RepID=UPI0029349244|nr:MULTISPECIES: GNAT family N-acetyltransferase [unclassified Acinetobacter]WOE31038.1 GNAT family N-acetyltransferase [Acinetobacter sp. SAAs470]WOE39234.1 GNAT family N-acetyltransferase [Acinetobacter sp. SAAs474]
MPITVHPQTSVKNDDVRQQLQRLYDTSPEFEDGKHALEQLEQQLNQYTVLYTAEFNCKIIGAIWCRGQGDSKHLEHLVIHPANRGRGVAQRLIAELYRLEQAQGIKTFQPGCVAIQRCLAQIQQA